MDRKSPVNSGFFIPFGIAGKKRFSQSPLLLFMQCLELHRLGRKVHLLVIERRYKDRSEHCIFMDVYFLLFCIYLSNLLQVLHSCSWSFAADTALAGRWKFLHSIAVVIFRIITNLYTFIYPQQQSLAIVEQHPAVLSFMSTTMTSDDIRDTAILSHWLAPNLHCKK